jgi:hypothetical protein
MAQAGARIFNATPAAIGSSSNGRTSFAALYHLCVEVEDCQCFVVVLLWFLLCS